jgi:hypothetical protein
VFCLAASEDKHVCSGLVATLKQICQHKFGFNVSPFMRDLTIDGSGSADKAFDDFDDNATLHRDLQHIKTNVWRNSSKLTDQEFRPLLQELLRFPSKLSQAIEFSLCLGIHFRIERPKRLE